MELSRLPPLESAPWLLLPPRENKAAGNDPEQTFFSLSEDKRYVGRALYDEKLDDYYCKASPLGWLMILDSRSKHCFLLDPVTTERIVLPPLPYFPPTTRKNFKFVLSLPPTDPECRIMCARYYKDMCSIAICHLHPEPGHNCTYWMEDNCGDDIRKKEGPLIDVVACKGKFYGLTARRNLLFCVARYASSTKDFGDIKVWKLKEGSWVLVDDIGGRVFLLSDHNYSASWRPGEAMRRIKGNCVYFVSDDDSCLCAFDLDDRMVSTELIFAADERTRTDFRPFWLIPAAATSCPPSRVSSRIKSQIL